MCSCAKMCENFKNTLFYRTPLVRQEIVTLKTSSSRYVLRMSSRGLGNQQMFAKLLID